MYRYFEYDLEKNRADLRGFYGKDGLMQHSAIQRKKAVLKARRILAHVSFQPTDRVLDIGCGNGALLGLLSSRIGTGIGVDISEAALKHAPKIDNLHFQRIETGTGLGFEDESFDKVLVMDVLEHVSDPDAIVAECRRLLKRDGRAVVQVPFTGSLSELAAGKFHEGHLRYYDPVYLKNWLEESGFSVHAICVHNSVPLNHIWLRAKPIFVVLDFLCNLIPSRWYPWFGSITAVCSRRAAPRKS